MIEEFRKALILYRNHFPQQWKHWSLVAFLLFGVLITLATTYNQTYQSAVLFGQLVGDFQDEYTSALQRVYYDCFFFGWLILAVFFVRAQILVPVTYSFTVSNTLWLRLSPTTPVTMALYRSLIIFVGALLIGLAGAVWLILFSAYHAVPISLLYQANLSLIAYTIMTGALITAIPGKPTYTIESRQAIVLTVMILPIVMRVVKNIGTKWFGNLYPFTSPYFRDDIGWETLKGSLMALAFGTIILVLNIGIKSLKHKSIQNA